MQYNAEYVLLEEKNVFIFTIIFYFSWLERDDRSVSGWDRNRSERDMGPDKTDSDWRARPKSDSDDGPRRDDAFGERKQLFHLTSICWRKSIGRNYFKSMVWQKQLIVLLKVP